MMWYLVVVLGLALVLWLVNFMVSLKFNESLSQTKSFECGFEHHHWKNYQPSVHFYKLSLVFILFDLELMFLLGLFNNMQWKVSLLILGFLVGTLLLEYNLSSLNWES